MIVSAQTGEIPGESARRPLSSHMRLAVVVLLSLHLGIMITQAVRWAPTYDEPAHLVAGLSYWRVGSFRLYCVNPPLVKLLAALPLSLTDVEVNWIGWPSTAGSRPEFTIAQRFTADNFSVFSTALIMARLSLLPFTLLGAWTVFSWTRDLAGNQAAVLALGMWCLSPDILAHGSLVTPDMPAAAVGVWAGYLFYRWTADGSWHATVLAGIAAGIACLTKFTWLVLLPLWFLLSVLFACSAVSQSRRIRLLSQGSLVIPLISLLVLNAGYGFEGTFQPLGTYNFVSNSFAGEQVATSSHDRSGNQFRDTMLDALTCPLPNPLMQGVDQQKRDFETCGRNFMAGTWSQSGWWYFYLYGFLIKSPVGFLGLFLLAALRLIRRRTFSFQSGLCLITAAVIIATVSSQTGMSLHFRYVVPAFGLLFVAVAAMVLRDRTSPKLTSNRLVWLCLIISGLETISVTPNLLTFANLMAGGPEQCHRHLADSSSDWGQDLYSLREWQQSHPECNRLFLACPYVLDPGLVGISYKVPLALPENQSHGLPETAQLRPGWYAISTNLLTGLEYPIWDGTGGGTTASGRGLNVFRTLSPTARAGWSIHIFQIDAGNSDRQIAADTLGAKPSETKPGNIRQQHRVAWSDQ